MYLYETHLHTAPVSRCAGASVAETLCYYQSLGYAGVFITNHFIDGNINMDASVPYAERIHFYFSDYEEGEKIGKELGISKERARQIEHQAMEKLQKQGIGLGLEDFLE